MQAIQGIVRCNHTLPQHRQHTPHALPQVLDVSANDLCEVHAAVAKLLSRSLHVLRLDRNPDLVRRDLFGVGARAT